MEHNYCSIISLDSSLGRATLVGEDLDLRVAAAGHVRAPEESHRENNEPFEARVA